MKSFYLSLSAVSLLSPFLLCGASAPAQEPGLGQAAPVGVALPHLVSYSGSVGSVGSVGAAGGEPVTLRFSLYEQQSGGDAVWSESQAVTPDAKGRYAILLGSATEGGLPQAVFSSAQAKWLGVSAGGGEELARTPLLATPYTLKASDAETVGGHPASDFVLAPKAGEGGDGKPDTAVAITQINTSNGLVGAGTGPTLNLSISDTFLQGLGNGLYAQLGAANTLTGNQTINGNLTVNGSFGGSAVNSLLTSANTVYPQLTGNNTLSGNNTFSRPITFAAAQTFPGTLTGITAGTGITAANSGGNVTVAVSPAALESTYNGVYAQLGAANTLSGANTFTSPVAFAAAQTFPNTIGSVTGGTDITVSNTAGAVTVNLNTSALDTTLNSSYAQLNSANVFGDTNTFKAGIGSSTSSSSGVAVYAVSQAGTNGIGVSAGGDIAVNAAGANYGVNARSSASGGIGVSAVSPAGTLGYGVYATGDTGVYGSGGNYGVAGKSTGPVGYGVSAVSASGTKGYGVYAIGDGGVFAAGANYGVNASSSASGGYGVYGASAAGTGGYGVYATGDTGVYASGKIFGVRGTASNGAGIVGVASSAFSTTGNTFYQDQVGTWADAGTDGYTIGLLGTADNSWAGWFQNNGPYPTILVVNKDTGGANATIADFEGSGGDCDIDGGADLTCDGKISTDVAHSDGRTVAMYAPQATENWLEDYGSGKLEHGMARITLDPDFADLVNTGVEYHVFLTPKGDCKGLFVGDETAAGFAVRELGGGTAAIAFDYKIVAKRKGYEPERMEDRTERVKRLQEMSEARHFHRATGETPVSEQQRPPAPAMPTAPSAPPPPVNMHAPVLKRQQASLAAR